MPGEKCQKINKIYTIIKETRVYSDNNYILLIISIPPLHNAYFVVLYEIDNLNP